MTAEEREAIKLHLVQAINALHADCRCGNLNVFEVIETIRAVMNEAEVTR